MKKQQPDPKKTAAKRLPVNAKKMGKMAASAANEGIKEYTYMALPKNNSKMSKTTVSKKK